MDSCGKYNLYSNDVCRLETQIFYLLLCTTILLPLLSRPREQVAMPFIRPIQKAFFAGQCREMLNLVKEDG